MCTSPETSNAARPRHSAVTRCQTAQAELSTARSSYQNDHGWMPRIRKSWSAKSARNGNGAHELSRRIGLPMAPRQASAELSGSREATAGAGRAGCGPRLELPRSFFSTLKTGFPVSAQIGLEAARRVTSERLPGRHGPARVLPSHSAGHGRERKRRCGIAAEQSPGVREESLVDGIRGLATELLPQPDFRADHEKTKVDVVPQIVHDELRRRPRPLQLIGQQSIKQDALGAKNLDSVRSAGSCDGERGGLAGVVGGTVEIPDADRPEPKVLLARYRHLVDRHLDMATDAKRLDA